MSVQLGAAQVFVMVLQKPLEQSPLAMQVSPFMQSGQVGPPQSVSVSIPFWTMSVQVGAAQVIDALQ